MLVSRDRIPARMDADTTARTLTSLKSAAVPMVATAVCAIVRTARFAAAIQKDLLVMATPPGP